MTVKGLAKTPSEIIAGRGTPTIGAVREREKGGGAEIALRAARNPRDPNPARETPKETRADVTNL